MNAARSRLLLLTATLAVIAVDVAIARAWGTHAVTFYVRELSVALVWSVVGAVAWWRRPRSRIGLLMMLFGLLLAVDAPAGFALRGTHLAASVITTVAAFFVALQAPFGGHMFLAFPSGRLPDRVARWFVAAGYAFGALDGARMVLAYTRRRYGEGPWAQSLLRVTMDVDVQRTLGSITAAGWLIFAVGFVVLLVRRVVRASRRERRALAFPFAAVAVVAVMFAVSAVLALRRGTGVFGVLSPNWLVVFQVASVVAVPVAFLVGLLRERLAYASVGDLVRAVAGLPADRVQPALARALGDPSLQLVFPVAGGHVDAQGRPVQLPPPSSGRSVTPLGDAGAPVAVLIHDRALGEEPALLQAAGAATRLALDNARLHAEVKAQLAEVRASRARLVAAGDTARRRLERDLHDGAQQRLLTAGLTLQMLRQQLPNLDTDRQQLLAEAETELRQALHELRELARGIHPAILTDQGLRPAIDQLALRCPIPVTVTGDPGRLPPAVESTAYFVVNEALANVVKHAHASRATIDLAHTHGRLHITITDDGVGGADPSAGTGLAGLADRIASIDGHLTITSPPHTGTHIIAEMPSSQAPPPAQP